MDSKYIIEIVSDAKDLFAQRSNWEDLLQRAHERSAFARPSWQLAWWSEYGAEDDLRFYLVRQDSSWVALAPFFLRRRAGVRTVCLLGRDRFDDLCFLIAPGHIDAVRSIAAELLNDHSWDAIELSSWSGSEEVLAAFLDALRPASRILRRVYETAPFVEAEGTWDAYLSKYKSSFRKWTRKVERKATEHPNTTIQVISGGDLQPSHIDRLVDLESRSRHWSEGTGHFADPRFGRMLKEIVSAGDHDLELRVLSSNEQWVAAELLLIDGERLLGLWTTFDDRYAYTGTFIVLDAIRSTFERNFKVFDFLQGDEDYKLKWATGARAIHQVYIAKRSFRSSLPFMAHLIRWRAARSERLKRWRAAIINATRQFRRSTSQGGSSVSESED